MRLSTIWTIPAMSIRDRIDRTLDWSAMRIAARLPKRIKYWTFILTGAKAIPNDAIVPEVLFCDLLKNIDEEARS